MVFTGWNPEGSAKQLLATEAWQALHTLLTEFRDLCRASGILPVLLYLPTKSQVYAEYATARSGRRVVQATARQATSHPHQYGRGHHHAGAEGRAAAD
jgi:hypothetical protein